MKFVFLYTNAYLHYQMFDQIKWVNILESDQIVIVVPPVIIRELNKHKDTHPHQRVKKRAAAVIKKLHELVRSGTLVPLNEHIGILFEDRDPLLDYQTYQLNKEIQDDQLIASVIVCRIENPGYETLLVTSDYGLHLLTKARRQEITTVTLPDNLKLAEEPDPEQKRIKELEQKIHELTQKLPQPALIFSNESQHLKFDLYPATEVTASEIQEKAKKIRQEFPKLETSPSDASKSNRSQSTPGSLAAAIAAMSTGNEDTISAKDAEEYNRELDKFYQSYEKYLEAENRYSNFLKRVIKLNVLVTNTGTAPAEDLDVFMHFPDGFELLDEDELPEPPEPPQPPARPLTQRQKILRIVNPPAVSTYSTFFPSQNIGGIRPTPNVSSPRITRSNSYDVDLQVRKVKHNLSEELDLLFVVFDSFENASSFQIDYRILAGNLPQEVEGKLHVIIQKHT